MSALKWRDLPMSRWWYRVTGSRAVNKLFVTRQVCRTRQIIGWAFPFGICVGQGLQAALKFESSLSLVHRTCHPRFVALPSCLVSPIRTYCPCSANVRRLPRPPKVRRCDRPGNHLGRVRYEYFRVMYIVGLNYRLCSPGKKWDGRRD